MIFIHDLHLHPQIVSILSTTREAIAKDEVAAGDGAFLQWSTLPPSSPPVSPWSNIKSPTKYLRTSTRLLMLTFPQL